MGHLYIQTVTALLCWEDNGIGSRCENGRQVAGKEQVGNPKEQVMLFGYGMKTSAASVPDALPK
jgi:hypothetical protein